MEAYHFRAKTPHFFLMTGVLIPLEEQQNSSPKPCSNTSKVRPLMRMPTLA